MPSPKPSPRPIFLAEDDDVDGSEDVGEDADEDVVKVAGVGLGVGTKVIVPGEDEMGKTDDGCPGSDSGFKVSPGALVTVVTGMVTACVVAVIVEWLKSPFVVTICTLVLIVRTVKSPFIPGSVDISERNEVEVLIENKVETSMAKISKFGVEGSSYAAFHNVM